MGSTPLHRQGYGGTVSTRGGQLVERERRRGRRIRTENRCWARVPDLFRGTIKGSGVFVYAPQKLGSRLAIIHFSSRGGELTHGVSLIDTLIYGEQLVRIVGRCKK